MLDKPMADNIKMEGEDEKEQRMRERIKAKKEEQKRRESQTSQSCAIKEEEHHPEEKQHRDAGAAAENNATQPPSKASPSSSHSSSPSSHNDKKTMPRGEGAEKDRAAGRSSSPSRRGSNPRDRPPPPPIRQHRGRGREGGSPSSRRHRHRQGRRGASPPRGGGWNNGGGGGGGYDYRQDWRGGGGGPPAPYYRGGGGPPPPPGGPYDPYYGPPPPGHVQAARGGGGGGRYHREVDDFGRARQQRSRSPPPRSRSRSRDRVPPRRSRSASSSSSRSASSVSSRDSRSDDDDDVSRSPSPPPRRNSGGDDRRRHFRSSSRGRSHSVSSRSSYSDDDDSDVSSRSSVDSRGSGNGADEKDNEYTKDQRTVFITQLVQRTTERDLKRFFHNKNFKVNDVILLRDKRTGRHKGCAYVELRRMQDMAQVVALSNQPPDFQRFPILIKSSEAEKNYMHTQNQVPALTATQMGSKVVTGPILSNGKLLEAQKVYVGSLDPSITQEHLFVLYSQFGHLEKVAMQVDTSTGASKGFSFLSFRDAKEANLAIQTMSGQVLAGRPMKTGWAVNQIATYPGATVTTSDEFPLDASNRATNAYRALAQLNMGVPVAQIRRAMEGGAAAVATPGAVPAGAAATAVTTSGPPRVATVAEARASMAAAAPKPGASAFVPPAVVAANQAAALAAATATTTNNPFADPTKIGNADKPSCHILVHNMFNKDEETDAGWEEDIKLDFTEECTKFGKILSIRVISEEVGGKIYASFDTVDGAQRCAVALAGRWFDKRRLCVEFVRESDVPTS